MEPHKRPGAHEKRDARKKALGVTIPSRFVPQFWSDLDGRLGLVQEIRRRYELLKADTGAESYQRDLLCQRAIWVLLNLETMEVEASKGGVYDAGVYTQMLNSFLGILKALGLDSKAAQKVMSLKTYVQGRGG